MNKTIENQCERVAVAIEKIAAELGSALPREEALHSHFMKSECGGIGRGASVGGGEAHSHFMKSECGGIGRGASVGGGEAHSHFMKSECRGIGSGASVGGGEAHSHFMKSECGDISNCKNKSRKGN